MRGAVAGLSLATLGCLLFIPASQTAIYGLFLLALFVLASGIVIVQVVANPLISLLGPAATSHSRLTFAQAFNSLGTTLFPIVGAVLILGSLATVSADDLSGAQLDAYRTAESQAIVHGYLGFAAMTAPTVRAAIDLAVRYAATRTTAVGLVLEEAGADAALVIEERVPLGALREFAVLSLAAGLWQLGRALTGKPLVGTAECGFAAPGFVAQVPFAAGMLRFDRPAHRLRFARAILDLPITSADPVALELARGQCERELAAIVDAGLPARVRAAVTARLERGPGLPAVAKELRLSTRTLKRKLADRGTTF